MLLVAALSPSQCDLSLKAPNEASSRLLQEMPVTALNFLNHRPSDLPRCHVHGLVYVHSSDGKTHFSSLLISLRRWARGPRSKNLWLCTATWASERVPGNANFGQQGFHSAVISIKLHLTHVSSRCGHLACLLYELSSLHASFSFPLSNSECTECQFTAASYLMAMRSLVRYESLVDCVRAMNEELVGRDRDSDGFR